MEWKTVIVGLPIIRKLLAGQDVELKSIGVNLIPDDILFNAREHKPKATIAELEAILNSDESVDIIINPDGSISAVDQKVSR